MILLIGDTPVAGTIENLAAYLSSHSGVEVIPLVKRNYAHNAFALSYGAFGGLEDYRPFLRKYVREASQIFLHNVMDLKLIKFVLNTVKSSCKVFYQIHSPPLEGPQFTYDILDKFDFDGVFIVGQGHGRFVSSAVPVPNIIADPCYRHLPPRTDNIFCPHIRVTNNRWSNKFSDHDKMYLERHASLLKNINVKTVLDCFGRDSVTAGEIRLALFNMKYVIDDINTGLVHQTFFEGIKSGCIVFSAADLWTYEEVCETLEVDELPFEKVQGIEEVVDKLSNKHWLNNVEATIDKNLEFSSKYLGAERLARIYWNKIKDYEV